MLELDKKYLSIREVSERTGVPTYTLRYWEKEFNQIKPERHSGMRKFSPQDVEIIKKIKDLLYTKRLTIEGVKKYLKVDKRRKKNIDLFEFAQNEQDINSKTVLDITKELEEVLEILEN